MTTETEAPPDLEFDRADYLRKALRAADVSVAEMADYLGVNRNTVGRYINGRGVPDVRTMRLWALRCGVPLEWLQSGKLPHLDSNQEPSDPWHGAPPVSTQELRSEFLKRIGHTGVIRSAVRSRRAVES
jgi:transcriptional regulator with XRE-family HTH domain